MYNEVVSGTEAPKGLEVMIRNLVLDMGNVVLRFDQRYFMQIAGVHDEASQRLLMRYVFAAPQWVMMDRGISSEAEMLAYAKSALPKELHEQAEKLIYEWDRPIVPIEGMEKYIRDCKAQGLKIYLLSNASTRQHEYWQRVPAAKYFDGTMISADEHLVKPMPEFYLRFLNKFSLKADECLFIDDVPLNIESAMYVGMNGIVFDGDVEWLRMRSGEFGIQV